MKNQSKAKMDEFELSSVGNAEWFLMLPNFVISIPIKPKETIIVEIEASNPDVPVPEDGASRIIDVHWLCIPSSDDPIQKPVPVSMTSKVYTDLEATLPRRHLNASFFNSSSTRKGILTVYKIEERFTHLP
ncbi:hypothetical protein UY286_21425 [Paenibacillus polymyxa]|uniref:hypothetical protein n=1 Tax=Paenibacillus polymyxa TaxID=1406 RepID=UPI002AB548D7|nr:hypothetical protein [Paenibacillus polymyxa]MDY7993398.1 hypothetical protein [Paenibacillus polymyxa]MDY8120001.1 hypothetical protein [Paenibacillus polymyxa]